MFECDRPLAEQFSLVAMETAPREARSILRLWLTRQDWPSETVEDVVLAVNEAVSNAVDHAYRGTRPGQVRVSMRAEGPYDDRWVRVTVSDDGRWRPAVAREGATAEAPYRGHGLTVMRSVADEVAIRPGQAGVGTRVELTCRAFAPYADVASRAVW